MSQQCFKSWIHIKLLYSLHSGKNCVIMVGLLLANTICCTQFHVGFFFCFFHFFLKS